MLPLFKEKWMLNGIYQAIMLSKHHITLNPSLIGTALCFWDSTSNSFAFGPGPMTPPILDMAALFGFRPHDLSIDALADFEMKNRKVRVPMRASASEIMRLKTYSGLVMTYQGMDDPDQEHMIVLLFWLNKFIFPHADEGVRLSLCIWLRLFITNRTWRPGLLCWRCYTIVFIGLLLIRST
ncbi:unnamed protein product [Prunus armeniaca]|uniref:Aminotransferase-like plant mobile domain-containing protein n=1 Tax=Prunus armeniaca TaxID=36596 RepID=A0A6J5XT47_PRUAR|nr:unnamed protein product [Prunus armeniaca]